jgi:signal transduction histidine kinase
MALLVVALWGALLAAGWMVTAGLGDDGIAIQATSFAPRPVPAPGEPVPIALVAPGSPAFAAGLRAGDLLVSVDGVPVSDTAALRDQVFGRRARETTRVVVRQRTADGSFQPAREVSLLLESRLGRPGSLSLMLTYAGVGLLILAVVVPLVLARPRERAAQVLLLAGGAGAVWPAIDLFYGGLRERWIPLGWDPVDQAGYLVALLNVVAFLHLFLVFPQQRDLGLKVVGLYAVPLVPAVVLFALRQSPVVALWALLVVTGLLAVGALAWSYVRPTTPLVRAQVKWVVIAALVVVLVLLIGPVTQALSGGRLVLLDWLATVVVFGLFYLALVLAVLRYRLFDVNIVLRATLLYPLLLGVVTVGYIAASFVLGQAAARLLGPQAAADPAVRVVAALAVAAAFHPLRLQLQRALDTLGPGDPRALRRFTAHAQETLSRALPAEDVETLLTRDCAEMIGLDGAWVIRAPGTVAASTGEAPTSLLAAAPGLLTQVGDLKTPTLLAPPLPGPLRAPIAWLSPDTPETAAWFQAGARLLVPLRTRDRLVGIWAFGSWRSPELPEREDFRTVEQIGRQAAILLDYAQLNEAHFAAQLSVRLAGQRQKITQEFTSMVSHELRTPIRAIKGFSTAMLQAGDAMSEADRVQCLQHIGEASDELLNLVGTLLDFSLIRAGVFTVDPRPTGLAPLIETAARQIRAARPSHTIDEHVANGLPMVVADAKRIEQVLRNLLDNATKYAPGGTTVRVDATYAPATVGTAGHSQREAGTDGGAGVLVSVSDEGAGIPAEELDHLFDRYRRGQSARLSTISGSGLGLAICKHLVEAHGGQIWVESPVPGRPTGAPPGTRVSFTLPTAERAK